MRGACCQGHLQNPGVPPLPVFSFPSRELSSNMQLLSQFCLWSALPFSSATDREPAVIIFGLFYLVNFCMSKSQWKLLDDFTVGALRPHFIEMHGIL